MNPKAYTLLMALLTSIGIKYEASNNNPFQQHPTSPATLLFLTAAPCHVLALNAGPEMNLPTTNIIFHASGIVGCEALMWMIIVDQFLWWYIINVLFLLVASFCFNNYRDIIAYFSETPHTQNLEQEEANVDAMQHV